MNHRSPFFYIPRWVTPTDAEIEQIEHGKRQPADWSEDDEQTEDDDRVQHPR